MPARDDANAHYLRLRASSTHGCRPGADLGRLMLEVLKQHDEFPPFMRIIEISPVEDRRSANSAMLVTMTPAPWEPPPNLDHAELTQLFLKIFDHVPRGSWVGVASSLYAVRPLEPMGLVDLIRGLSSHETLDIAACNIGRYSNEPKKRNEPWLSIVLRKLDSRGGLATVSNSERAA